MTILAVKKTNISTNLQYLLLALPPYLFERNVTKPVDEMAVKIFIVLLNL